ncbi:MAG: ATP-binding protein [Saprospiraceae bacterium]
MNKIIFNLISNAVKYSKDEGSILINLKHQNRQDLKVEIVDDGIGIPKDQQKFILKRYYRGRNAINSQTPGTGLGLMIVKNLIEQDKGDIWFDSIEGEGTTFSVVLKNQNKNYHQYAVQQPVEEEAPVTDLYESTRIAEFSDAKILIVEDNDELRQIMVEKVGRYFQVFEASSGVEGLQMVEQIFPDLILTDLIMPEMDGMEMSRQLQQNINTNHIPIIMMTVLNNSTHKIESIESGIAAYLEKPVDFNFLFAKMTSTLAWQKKLRERYRHQTEIEDAQKFRNEKDAEFINNLEKFVIEKIGEDGLSVHDLCRHVGMSRTALYMKLKNMVDLSTQDFIIHTRLKYARRLLTTEDINIKEVAYRAGFANPKYFSTSFKKLFGQTPTSFLKSLQHD